MFDGETKRDRALSILIEAGLVATCPIHEDGYFEGPAEGEPERAYKLADSKWKDGSLKKVYSDRKDMKKYIDEAIAEYEGVTCWSCDKD